MSDTLDLAIQLINRPSVSPEDSGCQELLGARLESLGFVLESMPFGEVTNLWARRGNSAPLFVFAGHTDVVPSGPESEWHTHPFTATVKDGHLFGRGAADMKGSLAAMVTACEAFIEEYPDHTGSIAFLLTSDEEGPATHGTVKVVETLTARGEQMDWCLVGEPTSEQVIADTIKNGRRGSLSGELTIRGQQGHVAYPHLARNPIHEASTALAELCATQWDNGNDHFPPTTFQISNIHAGTGAENVIPGEMQLQFNFRFSSEVTADELKQRFTAILDRHGLDDIPQWRLSGHPFLTPEGTLVEATRQAISTICGHTTKLSTSGGTSDGRFIAPTGAQVIELGPRNATIHQVNECVAVNELESLSKIYHQLLKLLLI